jgi:hypothetical protein
MSYGRPAGEQLEERATHGVDVGAGPHALAHDLLGRHVRRRAERHARGGDAVVLTEAAGQAEVHQLHHDLAAHARDHDVAGLDVAMDDARLVHGRERRQQANGDAHRDAHVHGAALDEVREGLTGQELHHDERMTHGVEAHVEDAHDVGVAHRGERLGFAQEAHALHGAGQELAVQDLQRDGAPRVQLGGPVHHAHGAAAELLGERVAIGAAGGRGLGAGGGRVRRPQTACAGAAAGVALGAAGLANYKGGTVSHRLASSA